MWSRSARQRRPSRRLGIPRRTVDSLNGFSPRLETAGNAEKSLRSERVSGEPVRWRVSPGNGLLMSTTLPVSAANETVLSASCRQKPLIVRTSVFRLVCANVSSWDFCDISCARRNVGFSNERRNQAGWSTLKSRRDLATAILRDRRSKISVNPQEPASVRRFPQIFSYFYK